MSRAKGRRFETPTLIATALATLSLLVSLGSMIIAWNAGRDTNRLADRDFAAASEAQKRERRAYLSLEKATWEIPKRMPATGKAHIRVTFTVENMGATPAKITEYSGASATASGFNEGDAHQLEGQLRTSKMAATIFKSGTTFVGNTIDAAEHAAFFRGELQWMVVARVRYTDIFGDEHVTTQCIIATQAGENMEWEVCKGSFQTD